MRIYEITTEYTRGKYKNTIHDVWRVACETFHDAVKGANAKMHDGSLRIKEIRLVADTEL